MPNEPHNILGFATAMTLAASMATLTGCAAKNYTPEELSVMEARVEQTIRDFENEDPGFAKLRKNVHAYAIFPSIGKGGAWIGGSGGQGLVYEEGELIGSVAVGSVTLGWQLGGQAYSQAIFFENKNALNSFTADEFEFTAQVSAVAIEAGAAASTDFKNGMAVFSMAKAGLMYEATLGGQKYSFCEFD